MRSVAKPEEDKQLALAVQADVNHCRRIADAFFASRDGSAGLPKLAPVDAGLPKFSPRKSKSMETSAAVDRRLPQVSPDDRGLPNSRICKSNPRPVREHEPLDACGQSPGDLSPRQLAAARLIARGCKPADVAAAMKISRQGLWKWRRIPAFIAELRRLHETLARLARAPRR